MNINKLLTIPLLPVSGSYSILRATMKKMLAYCLLIIGTSLLLSGKPVQVNDKVQLTSEELKLYNLVTAYRNANGLGAIPLSSSLTFVAQTHAKDLGENRPDTGNCTMHSWSNKGKWQSCCYIDNTQKLCMWNKPAELTTYLGKGFEIAAQYSEGIHAKKALDLWKASQLHNAAILNAGPYKTNWNAMGIGIYNNYAVIWFGYEADKEGEPARPAKR
jgi:uncharacterized protein YkwD